MCQCENTALLGKKGMDAFNDGRWDEAIEHLKKAIRLVVASGAMVNEANLRNNLALVYRSRGFTGQAESQLKLALALLRSQNAVQTRLFGLIANHLRDLHRLAA